MSHIFDKYTEIAKDFDEQRNEKIKRFFDTEQEAMEADMSNDVLFLASVVYDDDMKTAKCCMYNIGFGGDIEDLILQMMRVEPIYHHIFKAAVERFEDGESKPIDSKDVEL